MASGQHRIRRHFADPHMLVKRQYNGTATAMCDICGSKLVSLTGYGCSDCNFHIHEACAGYFKEIISFFAHPWHALTLTRTPSTSCVGCSCDLCSEECPPGTFVYRCARCMFYVHPLCTMLPQTIRSPFVHAEHDLCMVPATSGQCCSACDQGLGVWQYRCGFCQLKLHIACASGAGEQEQGGAVATTGSSITTTGGAQQSNGAAVDVGRPIRRRAVAKSLLKKSFRHAIDAATGVLSSPVLDVLAAGCWN